MRKDVLSDGRLDMGRIVEDFLEYNGRKVSAVGLLKGGLYPHICGLASQQEKIQSIFAVANTFSSALTGGDTKNGDANAFCVGTYTVANPFATA